MFENEFEFEEFVKGLEVDDEPRSSHKIRLRAEMLKVFRADAGGKLPRLYKYVAAAIIIIAISVTAVIMMQNAPIAEPDHTQIESAAVDANDSAVTAEEQFVSDELDEYFARFKALVEAGDIDGLKKMIAASSPAELKRLNLAMQAAGLDPNNFLATADEKVKQSPALAVEPPQTEFVPAGVLSGLVTDKMTAEPIAGVKISLNGPGGGRAETDVNGFYHIDSISESGEYRIQLVSQEYVGVSDYRKMPIVDLNADSQAVRHFQLELAGMVDVVVVDANGDGISDVQVIPSSMEQEHSYAGQRLQQRTDSQGSATIGGLKPSGTAYMITAMHDNYAPASATIVLNTSEIIESVEIVMEKGIDVKGYAEYSDGVAAGDLRIYPRPDWWQSPHMSKYSDIDPNGYFTLRHVQSGSYNLNLSQAPEESGSRPGRSRGTRNYPTQQVLLPPESGLLVITVPGESPESLISIKGTIKFVGFEDEKTTPNVSIFASSNQGGHYSSWVQPGEKTFEIDGMKPGAYRLQFHGQKVARKILKNIEAPIDNLEVELFYEEKPRLAGVVISAADEKPVVDFKARPVMLKALGGNNYIQPDNWRQFNDAAGKFDFEVAGSGIYQVQIDAEGFASAMSEEISTDDLQPVTVWLNNGGAIKGLVKDSSGNMITGAKVIPFSLARGSSLRTSDVFILETGAVVTNDGLFILENLPAGNETIKVMHPKYSAVEREDIEVVLGKVTEGIEIVLTKGAIVEGYVYDYAGKPTPNMAVYFNDASIRSQDDASRIATAITDNNGFYSLDGLPEKFLNVWLRNRWQRLGVTQRAIMPMAGTVSQLNFGKGPKAEGQVVIDGNGLAETKLLLGGSMQQHSQIFRSSTLTDAQGGFQFIGVPAGQWGIYYQKDSAPSNNYTRIATFDMGQEDIDLGVLTLQGGRIEVTVIAADANSSTGNFNLMLQKGTELWGSHAGQARLNADTGKYVFENIEPGEYTITLYIDPMQITETITVKPDAENTAVSMKIPKGTCTLSGSIRPAGKAMLIFRSTDGKYRTYFRGGGENYHFENLPAGEYIIEHYLSYRNTQRVATVTLGPGESRTLDIDLSGQNEVDTGILRLQVVDENGIPVQAERAWLESRTEKVESISQAAESGFFAPAGEYELHVVHPGCKEVIKTVTIEAMDIGASQIKEPKLITVRLEKK